MASSKEFEFLSRDGTRLRGGWEPAASTSAKGVVVLAHGITVTKEEDGVFTRLARALARAGFGSLRFDFRGHGDSEGKQEDMTISGEYDDLVGAIAEARRRSDTPVSLLAASFGAVAATRYARFEDRLACLILWNPVLDLKRTFLEPELPWARASFNREGFAHLRAHGYLLLDDHFKIGERLIGEMNELEPYQWLAEVELPVLTIHGDKDTYVPYEVAARFGAPNPRSSFVTVEGSEHGFGREKDEAFAVSATLEWLNAHDQITSA